MIRIALREEKVIVKLAKAEGAAFVVERSEMLVYMHFRTFVPSRVRFCAYCDPIEASFILPDFEVS